MNVIAFRDWNPSEKVRLSYLDVSKHQERYRYCSWRLNNIGKGTIYNSRGCKTLTKAKPIYLDVKLTEAKFSWCVYKLKTDNQRKDGIFSRWNRASNVCVRSSEAETHKVRMGYCVKGFWSTEKGVQLIIFHQ